MAVKTYYTDKDKKNSIAVNCKAFWKNTEVLYNGKHLGTIKNQKELKKGQNFEIEEGKTLYICLTKGISPALDLKINGKTLDGSANDPKKIVKDCFAISIGLGALSLAIGLISYIFNIELLLERGIGIEAAIIGGVLILLAFGIKEKYIVALGLVVALIILDIAATFYFSLQPGMRPPTVAIIFKVFIVLHLFKGFKAIKELANKREIPEDFKEV